MKPMSGKVVVVTGASRGAGRGIASVVGEAGAVVYVTGRSVRGNQTKPELRGTTIEDTADMVTARGGTGIPVRVDHTVDVEIRALFERVKQEQGRLDLLVNNAWGGYEDYAHHGGDPAVFDAVFWEQPIERWDKMWLAGLRATLATTKAAIPLLFSQGRGLIVNTTLEIDPDFYDAALYYRTAKLALNYMTSGMAHDLHRRGGYSIAVIGLAMGWMRTEAVMKNFDEHLHSPEELKQTDSVEYADALSLPLPPIHTLWTRPGKYSACVTLRGNMALMILMPEFEPANG